MAKIERFFNDYSWLLKLGIVIIWLAWALQGYAFIKYAQSFEKPQAPREAIDELKIYVEGLDQKAEKMGAVYGPKEYFADLRLTDIKKFELKQRYQGEVPSPAFTIGHLQNRARNRENFFSEMEREAQSYREWLIDNPRYRGYEQSSENVDFRAVSKNIFWWLLGFYFRTLPLVLLYYFVRMAERTSDYDMAAKRTIGRSGILRNILSGKAKFFFAIFLWPYYFSRYPYNVVREIVVEAELRRLKGLFHKFNPAERLAIREIANSDGYKVWRENLRSRNRFRHAFATALLVTIAIHALAPIVSATDKGFVSGASSIVSYDERVEDDTGQDQVPDWVEPSLPPFPSLLKKERAQVAEVRTIQAEPDRSIDQIPDFGCFRQVAFNF